LWFFSQFDKYIKKVIIVRPKRGIEMLDRYDILGSIILIDNIIFYNKNGTRQVDHSKKGRPCVIVAELEQYYFCPFTSHVELERLKYYQGRYYGIEEKDTVVEPYYETITHGLPFFE